MGNKMVRLSVRFDLSKRDYLKAWKLLSDISKGNKSSFCIDAILNMDSKPKKNDIAYQIKKSNEILGKIVLTKSSREENRKKINRV